MDVWTSDRLAKFLGQGANMLDLQAGKSRSGRWKRRATTLHRESVDTVDCCEELCTRIVR